MKSIKPFSDVKTGNVAYEHPFAGGEWDNQEGPILWKGNIDDVLNSEWKNYFSDWDMTPEEATDIDFVVVETNVWGPVLFNYNLDPCGVVCFEE